jgi:iron(III) transport system permease protein
MGGILSVMIAYLIERVRPRGSKLLGFVALLPAVVPGVIFGVGYLVAFNNPLGLKQLALTGTAKILVVNIMVANIFVGVLAGKAMLQRLDASVDEAAEILGASMIQRFFLVILPMLQHVLLLASLYIFVHGMTTLSAVIFLVSPGHNLASVGIFLNAESGRYGLACSMSVLILLIVMVTMTLFWLAARRGPKWARFRLMDAARGSPLPVAVRRDASG